MFLEFHNNEAINQTNVTFIAFVPKMSQVNRI